MDIHVHLERKHAYIFALFTTLLLGGLLAVAFGGNDPTVFGHSAGELDLPNFSKQNISAACTGTQKVFYNGNNFSCTADIDTDTTGISSCSLASVADFNLPCGDSNCGVTCASVGGGRMTGGTCDCSAGSVMRQVVSVGAGNFGGSIDCTCTAGTAQPYAFCCS